MADAVRENYAVVRPPKRLDREAVCSECGCTFRYDSSAVAETKFRCYAEIRGEPYEVWRISCAYVGCDGFGVHS
jgi:hypothetical protein